MQPILTANGTTQAGTAGGAEGAMLPLDAQRAVTFKDGKFPYTFYFSRITQRDWERYFEGITYTSHHEGKAQVTVLELDLPGIELVERKLERVEGYEPGPASTSHASTSHGVPAPPFTATPGWQSRLLPRHTRPAAWLLRAVSPSSAEDERPIDPFCAEVRLDAAWGMSAPGRMASYKGLVHRFSPPTLEHKRSFYFAGSVTRVVGGSRHGKTIHSLRHKLLLALYDELILAVEGYSVAGQPLLDPPQIRREMDAYHKVKAVELLFVAPASAAMGQDQGEDQDEGEEGGGL